MRAAFAVQAIKKGRIQTSCSFSNVKQRLESEVTWFALFLPGYALISQEQDWAFPLRTQLGHGEPRRKRIRLQRGAG